MITAAMKREHRIWYVRYKREWIRAGSFGNAVTLQRLIKSL